MHDTAHAIGRLFFETYFPGRAIAVLDIGSQSVNGSLRDCAPAGSSYTGVDLGAGPGVDVVLDKPPHLPFFDQSFDAVVSSSAFEHDPAFWLTFTEMLRVTKRRRPRLRQFAVERRVPSLIRPTTGGSIPTPR